MRTLHFVFALLLIVLPGCDLFRDDPIVVRESAPHPTLDPAVPGSVVRVDMGGRFRGSGIAVGPRHVVTALGILSEYEFHRRRATVGPDRIPATVTAVDARRGLALIRTERPLARWAELAPDADPEGRLPAVVVGYADVNGEPPMVEMRVAEATVDGNFHGESAGELDLRGTVTVSSSEAADINRRGAAVFDPATGRLCGMVIGSMSDRRGSSAPFIAAPASMLRPFLAAHGALPR